jgi:hypothetical protein
MQQVANNKCHEANGYESYQSKYHITIDGHDVAPTFAGEGSKCGSTTGCQYRFSQSEITLAPGPISQVVMSRDIAIALGF